jgi:hypothetical protein
VQSLWLGLNNSVVIGMASDPVPNNAISIDGRQSAVSEADSRGIDVVLAFEFLELQAGMPRIALKDSIGRLASR